MKFASVCLSVCKQAWEGEGRGGKKRPAQEHTQTIIYTFPLAQGYFVSAFTHPGKLREEDTHTKELKIGLTVHPLYKIQECCSET